MRRRAGATIAALVAIVAILGAAPATLAADPTFGRPTAEASFGEGIVFRQPVDSPVALDRVEILLEYPESLGPLVVEVAGATPAGSRDHRYTLLAGGGQFVPNTPITARWRLVPADRGQAPVTGPPVRVVYRDTRFDWRTLTGDLVRLHWYEGSAGFGRRALEIGERAVKEAADFLGVTESEPIDFFVYADQDAFYDALGPATRENVGGQAHSDIRTMFALIGPGDVTDPWVEIVIPHELTHLVFDTAVSNPYHFPPRWLNEGVATYLSEGYTTSDRRAVEGRGPRRPPHAARGPRRAVPDDRRPVLPGVRGERLGRRLPRPRARRGGARQPDQQLRRRRAPTTRRSVAAVGLDVAGFERAWLDDLGADVPTQHGPQPAPAGPLPADWTTDGSPAPSAAPGAATPIPTGAPASPVDPDEPASPLGEPLVLVLVAGAGVAVGGALGYARRRSRPPTPPA